MENGNFYRGESIVSYIPTTNVLLALHNILEQNRTTMPTVIDHRNNNRINSEGDLLEFFVKDAFCGDSFNYTETFQKEERYRQVFSYLGNSNNPPDFIISRGPAVEVKKIKGIRPNVIPLNSSHPKDYLYSTDARINLDCRTCEDEYMSWDKKDMIYAIGNVDGERIYSLWLVYGDCYCADKYSYERIATTIKDGVNSIPGIEFAVNTKELGKINRVDPLGITYLRVRGMWGISHPSSVFRPYIGTQNSNTTIYVLMKKETYENIVDKPDFTPYSEVVNLEEVQIPDPNNPARLMEAILIKANIN